MGKVSLHAVDQMYKTYSDDPLLMLLELSFPNNDEYFIVNNIENITSNSQKYTAIPFTFTLPVDNDEEVPELIVTISNVGLELIESFSVNTGSITANVKLVFASRPDFVELIVDNLKLKSATYDSKFISISLGYDDVLNVKVPSQTYSSVDYPGLLRV